MPRCKWLLAALLVLAAPLVSHAREAAHGWCEDGNQPVVTSGLTSSTLVQASYPQCTVTVLVHGGGLATIYSDNNGTVLSNPFTAQTNGQWIWYANNGHYDVTMSAAGFPQPVTYSDILLCDGNDPGAGTPCGGGGGGSISGSGILNFYALWTPNSTTLGTGSLLTVPSLYDASLQAFGIGGPLLFPFTNSASGTTTNLLASRDANGNAILLPFGQVTGIIGAAYTGAGTSGTVQMAVAGKAIPCLFDNQTIINDFVVASTTVTAECHDSGIPSTSVTQPGGFQCLGAVSVNNVGSNTVGKFDNLPDTCAGSGAAANTIAVNDVDIAGGVGDFQSTTPAAPTNFQNATWATDNLSPVSHITSLIPQATLTQAGIVKLAQDLGGTYLLPLVVGLQGNPLTITTLVTNQTICATSPTSLANCYAGVPVRTNSGATDTILAADRVGWVVDTNAGNVAVTIPAIGTLGAANFPTEIINNGGGTVTVTPTSANITKNGTNASSSSSATIAAGQWCQLSTDNTNWWMNCSAGGGGGGGGGTSTVFVENVTPDTSGNVLWTVNPFTNFRDGYWNWSHSPAGAGFPVSLNAKVRIPHVLPSGTAKIILSQLGANDNTAGHTMTFKVCTISVSTTLNVGAPTCTATQNFTTTTTLYAPSDLTFTVPTAVSIDTQLDIVITVTAQSGLVADVQLEGISFQWI